METVAMFPLGTVLFPHMPLPLRIFEERYRVMLGRLLDEEDPEFGVVLIERGPESGGGEQRFMLGTMARLSRVAAGANEIAVVGHGTRRIEVAEWLDDDPYPRARVRPIGEFAWSDAHLPLRTEAERIVRRALSRASEFDGARWDPEIELADDPLAAAWQLAGIAPLGPLDQLTLLAAESMPELLMGVIAMTRDAEPALTSAVHGDALDDEIASLLDDPGDQDDDPPGDHAP